MRKWATNSQILTERIQKEEKRSLQKTIKHKSNSITEEIEGFSGRISQAVCNKNEIKAVGIPWNRNNDTLNYNFRIFHQEWKIHVLQNIQF